MSSEIATILILTGFLIGVWVGVLVSNATK